MSRAAVTFAVALLAACDQPPLHSTLPAATASASGRALDPHMTLATFSSDVTFKVGAREVPATITTPKDAGPWPAVVLMAGSGPTDRNWNSPMLKQQNGSGKLLAEELAKHGMVVIRFDKAASGKNLGPPAAEISLDTYRDEGLAAVEVLRTRDDVRKDRVFIAGHSEGGMHATRVALAAKPEVAGVIYLSATARPLGDVMLAQLEGNLRNPLAKLSDADVKKEMASLRAALADLYANRPVDPVKASSIPKLQELVAGLTAPETVAVTRALLSFDAAAEAAKLTVPVFIESGGKDVQVDPELDAKRLEKALKDAHHDVTLHISPDADHVLKHQPKSLADLEADLVGVQDNYNAEGRVLDEDAMRGLMKWLADRAR